MPLETRIDGVLFTQSSISTLWTIVHNLGTLAPAVDVWVDDGFGGTIKILADTVSVVDTNTLTLGFTIGQSGQALVA